MPPTRHIHSPLLSRGHKDHSRSCVKYQKLVKKFRITADIGSMLPTGRIYRPYCSIVMPGKSKRLHQTYGAQRPCTKRWMGGTDSKTTFRAWNYYKLQKAGGTKATVSSYVHKSVRLYQPTGFGVGDGEELPSCLRYNDYFTNNWN